MSKEQKHADERRWAIGRDTIGPDASTIYMRRWFFWTPWGGVRLHHILRSDHDSALHDHPWDFASLLLTRGYTEVVPAGHGSTLRREWPRWSLVRHKAEDFHRLVLDAPAWTLVLTGPKRKSWGFLTEHGVVPWRKYLGLDRASP